jgi:signal peptidase I
VETTDPAPPEAPARPSLAEEQAEQEKVRSLVEWVAIIVGALIVALIVKTFLVQAFYIPSGSMEPTLQNGDRVLVNKMSYRMHDVNRGDIVVFERPPKATGDPNMHDFIKRVIAVEGETVEARNGRVFIDGKRLEEPYLPDGTETTNLPEQDIPQDHIWVMGDNRGSSSDSRVFGAITEESIVGRAFIRVWPLGSIGML